MNASIRVALVDDHVLIRKGLASLLAENRFTVVIQANNGRHFIEQLENHESPDVVLLDISMPVMDGFDTARWIRNNRPEIKILALSVTDDEDVLVRMLHAGACGYLLKDCEPEQLTDAVNEAAKKGYYHNNAINSRRLTSGDRNDENGQGPGLPQFNDRELLFLRLICSDMTYKEIAGHMHLSPRTIDGYRDSLFEKLGVKSRVGLVLFAMKYGLVSNGS